MSDRVREALASALASRGAFEGASVLDLFAGTGALSFESISRGAARAVLVERDRRVARTIEESASALGIDGSARVLSIDLFGEPDAVASRVRGCPEAPFSLVFVAPPYKDVARALPLVTALAENGSLTPDAWIVLEHPTRTALEAPDGLVEHARYRYGDTSILLGQVA